MTEPMEPTGPTGPTGPTEPTEPTGPPEPGERVAERRPRRPISGLLGGLLLGLGVALLLFSYAKIAMGTLAVPLVVVLGMVAGLLWGLFRPTRRARATMMGPPPQP
jgi:hypothetical protein